MDMKDINNYEDLNFKTAVCIKPPYGKNIKGRIKKGDLVSISDDITMESGDSHLIFNIVNDSFGAYNIFVCNDGSLDRADKFSINCILSYFVARLGLKLVGNIIFYSKIDFFEIINDKKKEPEKVDPWNNVKGGDLVRLKEFSNINRDQRVWLIQHGFPVGGTVHKVIKTIPTYIWSDNDIMFVVENDYGNPVVIPKNPSYGKIYSMETLFDIVENTESEEEPSYHDHVGSPIPEFIKYLNECIQPPTEDIIKERLHTMEMENLLMYLLDEYNCNTPLGELVEHIPTDISDIHILNDSLFRIVCATGNIDGIEWFIHNYGCDVTKLYDALTLDSEDVRRAFKLTTSEQHHLNSTNLGKMLCEYKNGQLQIPLNMIELSGNIHAIMKYCKPRYEKSALTKLQRGILAYYMSTFSCIGELDVDDEDRVELLKFYKVSLMELSSIYTNSLVNIDDWEPDKRVILTYIKENLCIPNDKDPDAQLKDLMIMMNDLK